MHVARLARLSLTDAEIDEFTGQLGDILEHAADIEALDVGDEPTAHPLPMVNVLRADEVEPALDRELLLSQLLRPRTAVPGPADPRGGAVSAPRSQRPSGPANGPRRMIDEPSPVSKRATGRSTPSTWSRPRPRKRPLR